MLRRADELIYGLSLCQPESQFAKVLFLSHNHVKLSDPNKSKADNTT